MVIRKDGECAVDDCSSPASCRGMCGMHYMRDRRYGDPLHSVRQYVQQGAECAHEDCGRKPKRRGLCEKHAKRQVKYGETTDSRERRFWAKVDKNGPVPAHRPDLGPCWVWTGYTDKSGYGQFGTKGKGTSLPHRIAYQYLVGPIPKGLHLDHLCRNRACVNAAGGHLEPVTPRENIRRGDQGAFWGYVPDPIPAKPERPTACVNGCAKPLYKRNMCRPCYRRWLKDPSVERPSTLTPEQRFWAKVEKTNSCWLWTASVNHATGYGRFGVRHGVMMDAHRFSYLLAHGSIPEKHDVHHTCHTRKCVNPGHLLATTRSDNLRLRKNRRAA